MKNVISVRLGNEYLLLIDDLYQYYHIVEKDRRSKGEVIEEILDNGLLNIVQSIYVAYHTDNICYYSFKTRSWVKIKITEEYAAVCEKLFKDTVECGYTIS